MEDVWKRLGSAVKDGHLRFLSVSQIESFDPEVYGGCNRRWWFRRVAKSKEEQTKPSELGEKIHSQIEHYLRNGNNAVLGEIARSGLRFLPRPGKDLRLEWIFGIPNGDVIESPLVLAGVPLIGKADCAHGRGEWLDDDGVLHEDPDTCEVVDWKSTVRIHDEKDREGVVIREGLAKSADQLAGMHQMRAYAALATMEWPWKKRVVLAHGYFKTSWPLDALKRVKIVDTAGALARFKADEPLVEKMKYAATVKDVKELEPNLEACGAYRGCPHRDQCPRSPTGILANLFNIKRAPAREENKTMGLQEKRKLQRELLSAATAVAEGLAPEVVKPSEEAVAAEIAKLEAEESGIGAPDAPPPTDIAKASETVTTFGGEPGTPCAMGGQQAKMLDGSKAYSCGCGAIVRVRPKELADGFYALVPSHLVGEIVVKPAKPKKEKTLGEEFVDKLNQPAAEPTAEPQDKTETESEGNQTKTIQLALYLDCAPDHRFSVQRLEDLADKIAGELARLSDAVDIRCAPEKSPLAFGKWKGALAAAIRENRPERGLWAVSSTSELGMVAFEALLPVANMVVRGAK